MLKVLILEDSQDRIEYFKKNFTNAELLFTDIPQEAIKILQNNKIDYLFLDHDLGGTVFAKSDENSGYAVAKWLEENKSFIPANIFLHSLNPDGVKNMNQALPDAKPAPFIWSRKVDFSV